MFPWNQFPFNKEMKSKFEKLNQKEVNEYVQGMLGKVFPNDLQYSNEQKQEETQHTTENSPSQSKLRFRVLETHKYVFVRIEIQKREWLKQLKMYHTTNQLILEHIPKDSDQTLITLPTLVNKKGAKADYQDAILEIQLYKLIDRQLSEIHVDDH
ncbi:Hsp20/alpha crystallin family protein [Cytobacillus sp. FSL W7-1323]|uniref:Hsp20/alpha crystallin family protein n=1 Tax=Cytobacillus TaxID=2675230 RepID=UPI002785799C|nr:MULTISPECIES: Hsp20/alpha crystallin family protein [Cytobacillus]MDQ0184102.1 HSP20 family molecular chaperone IbpA [Cytobacillus kochii]MEA1852718.1 Hsp20/alpha crystallin family protein [Cytobacillus sp. OWB-43]